MHVLDFNYTHENCSFRPKPNTQRPQPPRASWPDGWASDR